MRRLWIGMAVLVAVGLVALVWAGFTDEPSVQYTGIGAVLAFLALLAAAAAVLLTWPQYQQFRREQLARPKLDVWLELADNEQSVPVRIGDTADVDERFVIKIGIENGGDAPMSEGVINFVTLPSLNITPIDPSAKVHYMSPLPARSGELVPGEVHVVHWSIARADITPGHHVFYLVASLGDPLVDEWPVMVEVTGDPLPAPIFVRARLSRR